MADEQSRNDNNGVPGLMAYQQGTTPPELRRVETDSTGALLVAGATGSSFAPLVLAGQGTKNFAAAATPEAIGGDVTCRLVMLTNPNAAVIAYGTSTSVSVTGLVGTQIPAGKTHPVVVTNLNALFVDVTTDGDDVAYTYYT